MEGLGLQTPPDDAAAARYSFLFPIGESRRSSLSRSISPNHSGHVRQSHPAVGRPALAATRSPPAFRAQWPMMLLPIRCHPVCPVSASVLVLLHQKSSRSCCSCMKPGPPPSKQLQCAFALVVLSFPSVIQSRVQLLLRDLLPDSPGHPHPGICPLRFGTVPERGCPSTSSLPSMYLCCIRWMDASCASTRFASPSALSACSSCLLNASADCRPPTPRIQQLFRVRVLPPDSQWSVYKT